MDEEMAIALYSQIKIKHISGQADDNYRLLVQNIETQEYIVFSRDGDRDEWIRKKAWNAILERIGLTRDQVIQYSERIA